MPRAAIFGCAGPGLSGEERSFFTAADPLGFILFARNCIEPRQVRQLVADLRAAVGREDAPVLIDQEGGRVARLRPPHWRLPPAAAMIGELYRKDAPAGLLAARLNARLIAHDLVQLGIDVNCAPSLDLMLSQSTNVIGDRAFGTEPSVVAALGRAVCDGFLAGGILPVIKHMPGHGRADVDSHHELPVVETRPAGLGASDFVPFKLLHDMPIAITAHVIYSFIDPDQPATTSAKVIAEVIRDEIRFDGLLLTDDIGMSALSGSFDHRAAAAIAAGCDVVLHCSGKMAEMQAVVAATEAMTVLASARWQRAVARRRRPEDFDPAAALAALEALFAGHATVAGGPRPGNG